MRKVKKETMETKCYKEIKEKIQSGEYLPGMRLIETNISKEMKISRTPVRKALAMLASDGYLTISDYHGAVVANSFLTKENYLEMLDIINLFLKQAIKRIENKQMVFDAESVLHFQPEKDWLLKQDEQLINRKYIRHLITGILSYLKNGYYMLIIEQFFDKIEQFAGQEVLSIINLSSHMIISKLKELIIAIHEKRFEEAASLIDQLNDGQILSAFR